jgi:hypothetical protein
MGCQVKRLRLQREHCHNFQNLRLWSAGSQKINRVLAQPKGLSETDAAVVRTD